MTRKKNKKSNRRRWQIRIFKIVLFILAIALPCVWLIGGGKKESEPMRVSRIFADHLIHARYDEACAMSTPESEQEIAFYADWIGEQTHDMINGNLRFKITHVQLLMPSDSINMVQGKVLVTNELGEETVLHHLDLKMIYSLEGWLVDFEKSQVSW